MDLFHVSLGFHAHFLPLPLLLALVMISIGYSGEIGSQSYGDGTTDITEAIQTSRKRPTMTVAAERGSLRREILQGRVT
jgi:hypothetical protein